MSNEYVSLSLFDVELYKNGILLSRLNKLKEVSISRGYGYNIINLNGVVFSLELIKGISSGIFDNDIELRCIGIIGDTSSNEEKSISLSLKNAKLSTSKHIFNIGHPPTVNSINFTYPSKYNDEDNLKIEVQD